MPKARQRYLLGKLTSMKRLKVFLDVAESSRINLKPIQTELFTHMIQGIGITSINRNGSVGDWQVKLNPEIVSFFVQRLENSRAHLNQNEILIFNQITKTNIDEYMKYIFTSKPNLKASYDIGTALKTKTPFYQLVFTNNKAPNIVTRSNPQMTVANSLKIDLKIMFFPGREDLLMCWTAS